jgi:hypothetical protein
MYKKKSGEKLLSKSGKRKKNGGVRSGEKSNFAFDTLVE